MMQTKKDDEFTHTLSKVYQSDEWVDFHTWVCLVDLVYILLASLVCRYMLDDLVSYHKSAQQSCSIG